MESSDSLLSWSPAAFTDERTSTQPTVTSVANRTVTSSSTSSRLRVASGAVRVAPSVAPAAPPLVIHHGDRITDFMDPATYDSYAGVRTAATLISLVLILLIGILYRERLYVGRKLCGHRSARSVARSSGGQEPHQDFDVEATVSAACRLGPIESPVGVEGGGYPAGVQGTDVESLVQKI